MSEREPTPLPDVREKVAARRNKPRAAAAAHEPQGLPDLRDHAGPSAEYDGRGLGDDCPIECLGVSGKVYWFLDVMGQMVWFDRKLDEGELVKLFGAQVGWLDKKFPTINKQTGAANPDRFDQRYAQRALINACQRAGLFDPHDCERGRGSHATEDGHLILHLGDRLLVAGEPAPSGRSVRPPYTRPTGRVDDLIFPTAKRLKAPDAAAATREEMWGLMIDHWDRWQWHGQRRVVIPEITSMDDEVNIQAWLVLGWSMMALVCGAMPQRPSLFVTGPSGAGKSELHNSLCAFIGRGWHIRGKDVTAAWVTQQMSRDRLAVLLDEKGAEGQNEDLLKRMLEIVKVAYDGSGIGRGGADGKSTTNELFSACQLGGVLPPSLKKEDRNRMIMVEIAKFPPGTKPYTQPKAVVDLGPKARRRMVEHWHRFDSVLQAYRGAMMVRNFDAREANTYGVVLACADMALFDDSPAPDNARIAHLIACIQPMLTTSRDEGEEPPEIAIRNMLSVRVSSAAGAMQETIGQWIDKVVIGMVTDPYGDGRKHDAKLQSHGLRIVTLGADHDSRSGQGLGGRSDLHSENWRAAWLVVGGRTHSGVAELFKSTDFSNGRWVTCFQRLKHVVLDADGNEQGVIQPMTHKRVRIGGGKAGPCVMVPLAAVTDLDELARRITDLLDAAKAL